LRRSEAASKTKVINVIALRQFFRDGENRDGPVSSQVHLYPGDEMAFLVLRENSKFAKTFGEELQATLSAKAYSFAIHDALLA
jgi:hypothetical protein